MNSKTLFIGENENIFEYLDSRNIEIDQHSKNSIRAISRKSNNNYVGYYQFRSGNLYYKIFIVPKIFGINEYDNETLQLLFLEFLKQYYILKLKYGDKLSTKSIRGNITDLSLDSKSLSLCKSFDELMHYKYLDALYTIKKFFQRHKRLKYVHKSYISQSVRHKIDLPSNIRSLDKSIVHQIKKEPVTYSKLASITLSVLKAFKKQRLSVISPDTVDIEELFILTTSNLNSIKKRFLYDKKFFISARELTAHKIARLFQKNTEHRQLYNALLVLSGKEYFDGINNNTESRTMIDNTVSLFFNPSDLYEWIVYDQLMALYPEKVRKHGFNLKGKKYYLRNRGHGIDIKKRSEPDFIIEQDDGKSFIVDAKWKVVNSFYKIQYEDVAKLKRDCKLRSTNKAILVYPKLPEAYDFEWSFSDDVSFIFQLMECNPNNKISIP